MLAASDLNIMVPVAYIEQWQGNRRNSNQHTRQFQYENVKQITQLLSMGRNKSSSVV
jgi:hypothetical protein